MARNSYTAAFEAWLAERPRLDRIETLIAWDAWQAALKNAAPQEAASASPQREGPYAQPSVAALGVSCKYTKGRCLRERCNQVLCCEAQDALRGPSRAEWIRNHEWPTYCHNVTGAEAIRWLISDKEGYAWMRITPPPATNGSAL
jgi:hypothetical protein